MTKRPAPPADPAAQRRKTARWRFYGKIGSLKLAEGALRAIDRDYAHRNGRLINGILHDEIWRAAISLGQIRKHLLTEHENDWRREP
jgi:hypothetical protein